MNIRSLNPAGLIARFLHILILAAIVAPGIVFRSRDVLALLTVLWFVLFAALYLLAPKTINPKRRAGVSGV